MKTKRHTGLLVTRTRIRMSMKTCDRCQLFGTKNTPYNNMINNKYTRTISTINSISRQISLCGSDYVEAAYIQIIHIASEPWVHSPKAFVYTISTIISIVLQTYIYVHSILIYLTYEFILIFRRQISPNSDDSISRPLVFCSIDTRTANTCTLITVQLL